MVPSPRGCPLLPGHLLSVTVVLRSLSSGTAVGQTPGPEARLRPWSAFWARPAPSPSSSCPGAPRWDPGPVHALSSPGHCPFCAPAHVPALSWCPLPTGIMQTCQAHGRARGGEAFHHHRRHMGARLREPVKDPGALGQERRCMAGARPLPPKLSSPVCSAHGRAFTGSAPPPHGVAPGGFYSFTFSSLPERTVAPRLPPGLQESTPPGEVPGAQARGSSALIVTAHVGPGPQALPLLTPSPPYGPTWARRSRRCGILQ